MADIVIMPRLSLNEETSLLSRWYVSAGDKVSAGDRLFSIETDKSTMDVDSEFEGIVLKKYYDDYAIVSVLTPVCIIGKEGEEIPELKLKEEADKESSLKETIPAESKTASTIGETASESNKERKKGISPRARRLAKSNGIGNYQAIPASGAENRILEEDVIRYMKDGGAEAARMF